MRYWWVVVAAIVAFGGMSVLRADSIPAEPAPRLDLQIDAAVRALLPDGADAPPTMQVVGPIPRAIDAALPLPLDGTDWSPLGPEHFPEDPGRKAPAAPSNRAAWIAACIVVGLVTIGLFFGSGSPLRRWSANAIAAYLERTGSPWGRREDLFLEKLVLELRLLRTNELTTRLALENRFGELDAVERPIRKMRARFRAVRREYEGIATRIGPVSDSFKRECATAIKRSGLMQAPVLTDVETESMRRLSASVERRKAELAAAP